MTCPIATAGQLRNIVRAVQEEFKRMMCAIATAAQLRNIVRAAQKEFRELSVQCESRLNSAYHNFLSIKLRLLMRL